MSLFVDNIVYVKYSKEHLLEVMNEFSKVRGYKINCISVNPWTPKLKMQYCLQVLKNEIFRCQSHRTREGLVCCILHNSDERNQRGSK